MKLAKNNMVGDLIKQMVVTLPAGHLFCVALELKRINKKMIFELKIGLQMDFRELGFARTAILDFDK
jgi:hypothetical protein